MNWQGMGYQNSKMDYRVKGLRMGVVWVVLVLVLLEGLCCGLMDRGVVRGVVRPRMGCRMLGWLSFRMMVGGVKWRVNVDG